MRKQKQDVEPETRTVFAFSEANNCEAKIKKHCLRDGMNSSTTETKAPTATDAQVSDATLSVDLSDGRSISVPLAWYPRLSHGTPDERNNWRLIGNGRGIHWLDLDEDISVENLLAGQPSREGQASLKRWLDQRPAVDR